MRLECAIISQNRRCKDGKNKDKKENREKRIKGWHKAVKYAMGWAKDE